MLGWGWGNTSVYVLNRSPTKALNQSTRPYYSARRGGCLSDEMNDLTKRTRSREAYTASLCANEPSPAAQDRILDG